MVFKRLCSFLIFIVALAIVGCNQEIDKETQVYFNDFESTELKGIAGANFFRFNDSQMLGQYNNEGFNLSLDQLPSHDFISLEFDLYIHDTWDGNNNGLNEAGDDHDAWTLALDTAITQNVSDLLQFTTTFSNGICISYRCLTQSFPNDFPFENNPGTTATAFLRGTCLIEDDPKGTTRYSIRRVFPHNKTELVISFYDRLLQTNSPDPKCDESWSLDNLRVITLDLN